VRGEGQRDSNLHPCAGPYNPTPSLESSLCRGEVAHKTKARPPTRSGLALCVFVASTQTCTDCSVHSREGTPCAEPVLLELENHRLTGARKNFAFERNASYHFDAHPGRVRAAWQVYEFNFGASIRHVD
jgi:hypothetical protein